MAQNRRVIYIIGLVAVIVLIGAFYQIVSRKTHVPFSKEWQKRNDILIEYMKGYSESDPELCLLYCDSLSREAVLVDDSLSLAISLLYKGRASIKSSHSGWGATYLNDARTILWEQFPDEKKLLADCMVSYPHAFYKNNDILDGIEFAQKALAIYEHEKDQTSADYAHFVLGTGYGWDCNRDNFTELCFHHHKIAIRGAAQRGDSLLVYRALNNMAVVQAEKRGQIGISSFLRAKRIVEAQPIPHERATLCADLGHAYIFNGECKKGRSLILRSIRNNYHGANLFNLKNGLNRLIGGYLADGMEDSADYYTSELHRLILPTDDRDTKAALTLARQENSKKDREELLKIIKIVAVVVVIVITLLIRRRILHRRVKKMNDLLKLQTGDVHSKWVQIEMKCQQLTDELSVKNKELKKVKGRMKSEKSGVRKDAKVQATNLRVAIDDLEKGLSENKILLAERDREVERLNAENAQLRSKSSQAETYRTNFDDLLSFVPKGSSIEMSYLNNLINKDNESVKSALKRSFKIEKHGRVIEILTDVFFHYLESDTTELNRLNQQVIDANASLLTDNDKSKFIQELNQVWLCQGFLELLRKKNELVLQEISKNERSKYRLSVDDEFICALYGLGYFLKEFSGLRVFDIKIESQQKGDFNLATKLGKRDTPNYCRSDLFSRLNHKGFQWKQP